MNTETVFQLVALLREVATARPLWVLLFMGMLFLLIVGAALFVLTLCVLKGKVG